MISSLTKQESLTMRATARTCKTWLSDKKYRSIGVANKARDVILIFSGFDGPGGDFPKHGKHRSSLKTGTNRVFFCGPRV